jgi:hypothetical protein
MKIIWQGGAPDFIGDRAHLLRRAKELQVTNSPMARSGRCYGGKIYSIGTEPFAVTQFFESSPESGKA